MGTLIIIVRHQSFHQVNPDAAYGNIVHRCCCLRRERSGDYGRCSAPTAGSNNENHEGRLDQVATLSAPPCLPEPHVSNRFTADSCKFPFSFVFSLDWSATQANVMLTVTIIYGGQTCLPVII